jgi:hypothetical protein
MTRARAETGPSPVVVCRSRESILEMAVSLELILSQAKFLSVSTYHAIWQSGNGTFKHCGNDHLSTFKDHEISVERRKFEEGRSRKRFKVLQYNLILVPLGSIILFLSQSL